uniref:Heterogeneous nuclear ribonucleoprotein L-like n=1 Tax=Crassostrea virginica TaxID=6565 RepID=A0A8B8CHR3_CRAVI|nr:heterogeneous nuclear ribonucleoprotein L-like [Crassostrea virginica]XP_022315359.1 heterogeneous nuclear ribonucleoprotein L-like [Crassostrea virginica]
MASGYEDHASKRMRMDKSSEDPIKPSPSPVVHVRGLYDNIMERDLTRAVQQFGTVNSVVLMPKKHQALIEFEDISGATNCVNYSSENQIFVAGQPAYFNYSTSQRIQRPGPKDENKQTNNILLFTVLNPQYPVTVDIMHTICSPYGQVLRIVIFRKSGVQSMVEFDDVESAKRAKQALNGADIYSDCNTLKIEYAKTDKLNVFKNDQNSWDYTNPNLNSEAAPSRNMPLLPEPGGGNPPYNRRPGPGAQGGFGGYGREGGQAQNYQGYQAGGYGAGMYDQGDGYSQGYGAMPQRQAGFGQEGYGRKPGPPPPMHEEGGYGRPMPPHGYQEQGGPPGAMIQGAVLMVYGLNPEHVNCDRLFNVFCLYGNVARVKFLKSKEGSAMIQMGDSLAVERSIQNLSHVTLFGSKLTLAVSKQAFLQDVPNPYQLPDGTPSFKDFMGSRNNRYANPEQASKNRIMAPTKVLHYFNVPPDLSEKVLEEVFTNMGAECPEKIKQFPASSARSSSGLVQFKDTEEAVNALALANHASIPNPSGKSPYVMKLCFSGSPIGGR